MWEVKDTRVSPQLRIQATPTGMDLHRPRLHLPRQSLPSSSTLLSQTHTAGEKNIYMLSFLLPSLCELYLSPLSRPLCKTQGTLRTTPPPTGRPLPRRLVAERVGGEKQWSRVSLWQTWWENLFQVCRARAPSWVFIAGDL